MGFKRNTCGPLVVTLSKCGPLVVRVSKVRKTILFLGL